MILTCIQPDPTVLTLMSPLNYRLIEHTADTGFEVQADSVEQVYENAAGAFFNMMWQIANPDISTPKTIEVTGVDQEALLVNFLEEFLYLYDAKSLVCTRIQVEKAEPEILRARAWLQEFDENHDRELLSVKAVTYHQIFIGRENSKWKARIFLDI